MDKPTIQKILAVDKDRLLGDLGLSYFQIKALDRLSVCRTAKLGGHAEYCENGHLEGIWYNSCRHRSCPQCQNLAKAQWLENTKNILLDCPHHHVIFTIAHELNALWRYNRSLMVDLLFQAAQQTLLAFADDERYLGAKPGILSALHTWGRNLSLHAHLHVLISHGGLSEDGEWIAPKKDILFPQKAVMRKFRGKFLSKIRDAFDMGKLTLPEDCRENQLKSLLNRLGRKEWTVHFCDQYVHGKGVAKYLARYVKGGAFNNEQIKSVENDQVRFLYKAHQTQRYEWLRLSTQNFVQRIAEHVLPPRKCGVRYSGLYSPSCRDSLNLARKALHQEPVSEKVVLHWEAWLEGLGHQRVCRHCQGQIVRREEAPREHRL
jgi:hypothetical protein